MKNATLKMLASAPEKMIISGNCTIANTTPIENIKMAIEVAHRFRG